MEESARAAYDGFAPVYDEWNVANDYEMWLGEVLLPQLQRHGPRTGWALDVGCGTGRAFPPLIARGWRVVGCDLSPGMLARARRKFDAQVPLLNLDARDLPPISPSPGAAAGEAFQLVLLLNDVVNYALEPDQLGKIFAGVERNLSSDGLAVFDANTLKLFREDYALDAVDERSVEGWKWRGMTEEIEFGGAFEARVSDADSEVHVHRERHWPPERVEAALEEAGLRAVAMLGQREESGRILLSERPDEERDRKVIYIARRSE